MCTLNKIFQYKLKFLFAFLFSVSISIAQRGVEYNYEYNVDNFPSVYGGDLEWKRFLHDHLVYPAESIKKKVIGQVHVIFIVLEDGRGVQPKITKSVSPDIDKEALRLVKMLEWFPALKKGVPVNVYNSVVIDFSISKYKKWIKERSYASSLFTDLPLDTSLQIYEQVDKGPSFYNTEKTFSEFISSNLEYPELAKKKGIEGDMAMSFIVEPDGRVSNIRIKEGGIAGGCNEEAIRVIGLTTWKPAIKNNMYVRYRMQYKMTFSLRSTITDNNPGSQKMWGQ